MTYIKKLFAASILLSVSTLHANEIPFHLPKMIEVPAGAITMLTCPEDNEMCAEHDYIERKVTVKSFNLSQTEIAMAQWDSCIADGGCLSEASSWAYKNRQVQPPCKEDEL